MPDSPFTRFYTELLSRLEPAAVVGQYVKLEKGSRSYRGLCPFHNDKNESFHVYLDDKHYHCFGCLAHGNLIDFVAKMTHVEYRQAAIQLAQTIGLEVPSHTTRTKNKVAVGIIETLSQVNELYKQQFQEHSTPRAYLEARGISDHIVKKYSIGYAPNEWNFLGPSLRGSSAEELRNAGLLGRTKDGRPYDLFIDRIMFPIRDYQGRVLGFGGRIFRAESTSKPLPKYINSPETSIFKKSELLYGVYELNQIGFRHPRLLLVEGYMDVVGLAQQGVDYALGILGTAVNRNHLRQLFAHTQEVVVCFDGDDAGRKAAERTLENVLPELSSGRMVRFLFLPEGTDPDSLIQQIGKTEFEKLIDQSETIVEYVQALFLKNSDLNSVTTRIEFAEQTMRLLAKIPHEITRSILADELASLFPDPSVQAQLKRILTDNNALQSYVPNRNSRVPPHGERTEQGLDDESEPQGIQHLQPKTVKLDISVSEKRMVIALLQSPHYCSSLDVELMRQWRDVVGHTLLYELWSIIVQFGSNHPSATTVLGSLQGEKVGDALMQIHDQYIAKNQTGARSFDTTQSESQKVSLSTLKTAIEDTISKQRYRSQTKTELLNSDLYHRQRGS